MNKTLMWVAGAVLVLLGLTWIGSTYNTFVRLEEKVIAN